MASGKRSSDKTLHASPLTPDNGVYDDTRAEQNVIRAKAGLLDLAKQFGNVSQACKMMGYSSFYRFKELSAASARPIRWAPPPTSTSTPMSETIRPTKQTRAESLRA
jgi:hypothetical protein